MKSTLAPRIQALICILFLLSTAFTFSDDKKPNPGHRAEEEGPTTSFLDSKSLEERKEWLRNNSDHDDFFDVLKQAISDFVDIDEAISFIKLHIPNLETDSQRFFILHTLGEYEKLSGNFESAQRHFQLASTFDRGLPGTKALFASAYLLFQMGEIDRCEKQIKTILLKKNELKDTLIRQTWFLYISVLIEKNNYQEAKQICDMLYKEYKDGLSSQEAYMLYTFSSSLKLPEIMEKTAEILRKRYPDSPEYSLVYGGPVEKLPWPRFYLNPEMLHNEEPGVGEDTARREIQNEENKPPSNEQVMIQTGSYTYEKNATARMRELKSKGFTSVIIEKIIGNTTYYAVVIPNIPMRKSQEILIQLKDQGIEGFLIF